MALAPGIGDGTGLSAGSTNDGATSNDPFGGNVWTDSSGNTISSLTGYSVQGVGVQTAGQWVRPPSIFRLRLSGTGTVSMDSKNKLGTITSNTFGPVTFSGETGRIEFPFSGTDADSVRFNISGSAVVEIL